MRLMLLFPLLLAACAEPREPAALVDHEAWTLADPAGDPWAEHAPAPVECSPLSWGVEDEGGVPALGVETGECSFLAVAQPSLADALAGDALSVRLWHGDLYAPVAALAHAGVVLGGRVVADFEVAIPEPPAQADSEMLTASFLLEDDVPAGTEVLFHLHNHGANSWSLLDVEDQPPE